MSGSNKLQAIALLALALLLARPSQCDEISGQGFFSQAGSGSPIFKIKLDEAAAVALSNSHTLAGRSETAIAARETAKSARTRVYPQIGLQGSTRMMSKVGQVSTPFGNIQAGQHYNWSVGPVLDWVAWDAGQIAKYAKSLSYTADSEKDSAAATERQVILSSRMAYFSVQLASEQLRLVNSALGVARSQYADVSQRFSVGSASRLDQVVAHQDVMERERDYENAEQELAVQLRNFFATLAIDQIGEPTAPVDVKFASSLKAAPIEPDLLIDFEPISSSISKMIPRAEGKVEVKKHPSYTSALQMTNSTRLTYESVKAEHWPKITVQGKSTYEYPNFGIAQRIQQNTLSLGLNLPVIDWGMISKEARSARHKNFAAVEQMKEVEVNLSNIFSQAMDEIAILRKARDTAAAKSKDASEAARLVYEEYLAGRVIFLEVQRANNLALQAAVDEARTDVSFLGQLATMESLITDAGDKNENE